MTVYNILRANLHQRIKIDNHNNRGVCFHKSCFNILPSESWKQSKLIVLSSADVTFFVFFLYLIENLILFSPWKINLFYSIYITYRKNSPVFFYNKLIPEMQLGAWQCQQLQISVATCDALYYRKRMWSVCQTLYRCFQQNSPTQI
jgi:hypothetical protein